LLPMQKMRATATESHVGRSGLRCTSNLMGIGEHPLVPGFAEA